MIFKVKGQGHQVKYLGEGICHALPLFSLDLESMIRNNVKIYSNLHVSQCVNLTVDPMAHVCVKIMQVFVKLSKFFRQITTKTGNFRQM